MVIVRILILFAAVGIGASLLAWLLTGNPRYRQWAWNFTRGTLLAVLLVLVLFAFERIFFSA
ncbi:hypothetical protein E6C76_19730 [Pseudothauera nasutitermitis]|uniref:Uncharacterized protein n=1 Tax=Pseudothauera nasutitermitis TaxID=2565930 RepID=A0A4S4AQ98_9RHOO|nr:hypothetical protein [Pseudothauera nasutitermitis]THF61890.1 hypothetical protein E6C76_19730 [Pseudothauera nasutitermitis]